MSAADRSFHGKTREIPPMYDPLGRERATGVQVYFSGGDVFSLRFSPNSGFDVNVWTTAAGLRAVIDACHAALARADL